MRCGEGVGVKDAVMLTRKEVLRALGVSAWKLRSLVTAGVLSPVHLVIGENGKPHDRAMYRRGDIEAIAGRTVDV